MAKINNNLIKKISELTLKNYHENGGNLGKAQAMTGTEIMMYELSRGRVKENDSKMDL